MIDADDALYLRLPPAVVVEPDELPPTRIPRRTLDAVKGVPCPACGALPGRPCRALWGKRGHCPPHHERADAWVLVGRPA